MVRAALITFFIAVLSSHARAEARIALLIGNQAYDSSVGILKNPYNDIAVVGQALTLQGFELLAPIKDARRTAILGRRLTSRPVAPGTLSRPPADRPGWPLLDLWAAPDQLERSPGPINCGGSSACPLPR
jgi:hypothetical protein